MSDADDLLIAKAALREIVTGSKAAVVVDQNGERVEFQRANLGALRRYIAELEAKALTGGKPIGPARVFM